MAMTARLLQTTVRRQQINSEYWNFRQYTRVSIRGCIQITVSLYDGRRCHFSRPVSFSKTNEYIIRPPISSAPFSVVNVNHLIYQPIRWFGQSVPPSSQRNTKQRNDEQHSESNHSIDGSNRSKNGNSTSDPPILSWVDDYVPTSLQPYARLARIDKPIGTWLLLWPCFWSTAIAAPVGQLPDPKLLSLFTVGAFVMRGAGCTINDMWDQDFDKRVHRTKDRPLASGDLTQNQALAFLAVQLSAGLGVLLSLPHTWYCFVWGASSLPLVVVYPLMKRYTNFPQAVLGLTFNWGAWMGWAATYGSMDYSVIGPLYMSGVTWTLVYDTIYANQDKDDDAKLGLKSTALTFGSDETRHKQILHGFAAMTWLQWLLAGYATDMSVAYSLGATTAYAHLIWQIQTANLSNPHNLAERFRSNATVGGIMFASIVAGNVTGTIPPDLVL